MYKPAATAWREGISAEAELLIACASTQIDSGQAERISALLQGGLDWASLMRLALRHGMLPLLYRNLHTTSPKSIPPTILNQLQALFLANAHRNLFLTGELLKLLDLFEADHIPAIPFKGPVLAASAYGNLSLRQFGDLDILVRRQDVPKAQALLISQGYRMPAPQVAACDIMNLPKYHILVSKDEQVRVDLQWRITRTAFSFPLDTDRLLTDLNTFPLAARTVRHLPPQYLLALLCIHGCKHRWERLQWICDVAEVVRTHQKADWNQIMDHADSWGARRMLALGLFLARDLLGTSIPDQALQRIKADASIQPLAAQVCAHLFLRVDCSFDAAADAVFYLKMRERLRDKMRYCLHYTSQYLYIAVTPSAHDRALLSLPAVLSSLYYIVRFMRMLRRYALRPRRLKRVLYEWFEILD